MTPCSIFGCPAPAKTREMCESHYRKRVRMGIYGYRDATRVLAHITRLRDLGWTWERIGAAAGISHAIPYGLGTGRYRRVLAETERALLAVPLEPMVSHHGIDSCGTRRRVQALAWMGWPGEVVAVRAGIRPSALRTLILPYRRISSAAAARVAAVYDELSHLPGPSTLAAGKARGLGHAPPAAWDDDTIDDPKARPAGVRRAAA